MASSETATAKRNWNCAEGCSEPSTETGTAGEPSQTDRSAAERDAPAVCPACGNGRMLIIETFHPEAKAASVRRPFFMQRLARRAKPDTS